ncbi:MAG: oligosaccharide flippase family protein, partial [Candidatus Margulisiibacteriota bacterium]
MEVDIREDSLRKRYVFKLGAQLIGLALSFITAGLVPRTLGPALYGVYNYLVDFFDNIVRFFTLGASEAFYNKFSHRQNDIGLLIFYLVFSVLVGLFLIIFIFFLIFTSLDKFVLPNQPIKYILLALILGLFYIFNNNQIMDGLGLTVDSEKIQLGLRIFNTVILISLFFINQLTLINLFISLYAIYLINIIICWYLIIKKKILPFKRKKSLYSQKIATYFYEFYIYCYPLFFFKVFVFFSSIFERWFLQIIAGNAQQGFYSLSFRISQIYFLFTSSLTPLLMREFSIAYHNKDIKKMA